MAGDNQYILIFYIIFFAYLIWFYPHIFPYLKYHHTPHDTTILLDQYHDISWPIAIFLGKSQYFTIFHHISIPYDIYIYRLKHHIFLTGDQVLCHIRCSLALELGVHRAEDEWSQKWIGGAFFFIFSAFWNIWVLNHHKPSIFGEFEP